MAIAKILVVDDEETISSYLQRKLVKLGYEVRVAGDGEAARELAFSTQPDLILMDVKLPKLTGTEVCRQLKADDRTKDIPILLLSAKAQPAEIQEGIAAGADRYLCKPISFPDILSEIKAFHKA
jgi:DNA-binding response OmpR family regulator